jgi:hypothetical protein
MTAVNQIQIEVTNAMIMTIETTIVDMTYVLAQVMRLTDLRAPNTRQPLVVINATIDDRTTDNAEIKTQTNTDQVNIVTYNAKQKRNGIRTVKLKRNV